MSYLRPITAAGTYLSTYADAIEHVSQFLGGAPGGQQQFLVRRAVEMGYRTLVQQREWKYLEGVCRINTNAPYATGTVQYTASSRSLELSGGTWPTWASAGRVKINDVISDVDSYVDSTHLTLSVNVNPGADIAAGASYSLYQNLYPLPGDFRSCRDAITIRNWQLTYIAPADWMRLERTLRGAGTPQFFTLWSDSDNFADMCLGLYPAPSSVMQIDLPYQRFPSPLRRSGWGANDYPGTISNTGTAVTGSGTNFTADMVGTVLRFGTAASLPSSTAGVNPYQDQQIVQSVTDSTHLTLAATPISDFSGVKYQLSDPVDLPEYMFAAFLRRCEVEACINLRMDRQGEAMAHYQRALEQAFEGDLQALGDRATPQARWYQWWNMGPLGSGQG